MELRLALLGLGCLHAARPERGKLSEAAALRPDWDKRAGRDHRRLSACWSFAEYAVPGDMPVFSVTTQLLSRGC
jgi:hypothetical protein